MPIDPSIALQIRPPTFPSPLEQAGKAYGLLGLIQRNKLAELALQSAQLRQPLERQKLEAEIAAIPDLALQRRATAIKSVQEAQRAQSQDMARTGLISLLNPQTYANPQLGGVPEVAIGDDAALRRAIELDRQGLDARVIGVSPSKVQNLALGANLTGPQMTALGISSPAARPEQYFAAGNSVVSRNTGLPGPYQPPSRPQAVHEKLVKDPLSDTGWSWEDALSKQRRTGAPPPANASQLSPLNPNAMNLHGKDYLSTLDPGTRNAVEAIVNYQAPLNSFSTRTGERRILLEHAKQADPKFDVMKYPLRQAIRKDFTSGPTANNITALDQAINHMGTLSLLTDALKNNDIRAVNAVVNTIREQTGDPRINNFQTAQTAVGTELMRVFRQVNASEQETKDWISKFPITGSPDQIQGALKTGAKLLEGRVNALNNRWNNGMETTGGYPNVLSPEARSVLDKFVGKAPSGAGIPSSSVLPSIDEIDAEIARRRRAK